MTYREARRGQYPETQCLKKLICSQQGQRHISSQQSTGYHHMI